MTKAPLRYFRLAEDVVVYDHDLWIRARLGKDTLCAATQRPMCTGEWAWRKLEGGPERIGDTYMGDFFKHPPPQSN